METKANGSITTHDVITYSHKAATHRQVHPYLRYGILWVEENNILPGRLFLSDTIRLHDLMGRARTEGTRVGRHP